MTAHHLPIISTQQVWQNENLILSICFEYAEEDRHYIKKHTIINAIEEQYESEIAFRIGQMFKEIYEDICADNYDGQ